MGRPRASAQCGGLACQASLLRDLRPHHIEPGKGCNIVKMLPSVSLHRTNVPTVGMSILSPRSCPPADLTFAIAWSILSTPTTHENAFNSLAAPGGLTKIPPLIPPGSLGSPVT